MAGGESKNLDASPKRAPSQSLPAPYILPNGTQIQLGDLFDLSLPKGWSAFRKANEDLVTYGLGWAETYELMSLPKKSIYSQRQLQVLFLPPSSPEYAVRAPGIRDDVRVGKSYKYPAEFVSEPQWDEANSSWSWAIELKDLFVRITCIGIIKEDVNSKTPAERKKQILNQLRGDCRELLSNIEWKREFVLPGPSVSGKGPEAKASPENSVKPEERLPSSLKESGE